MSCKLQMIEIDRLYRSKKQKLLCVHSDSGLNMIYIHVTFVKFGAYNVDVIFPHIYNTMFFFFSLVLFAMLLFIVVAFSIRI